MIKWLLVTVARIGRVKNWLGERQVSTLTVPSLLTWLSMITLCAEGHLQKRISNFTP